MSSKTYFKVTGVIFLVVALVHLARAINGWSLELNTWSMPMLASWVGFLVAGYLAYQGLAKK
jgi:hypothetical protein